MLVDYVDDLNEADHIDGFEDSNDLFEDNGADELVAGQSGNFHNNLVNDDNVEYIIIDNIQLANTDDVESVIIDNIQLANTDIVESVIIDNIHLANTDIVESVIIDNIQ
jgi:hypothetical protein